MRDDHLFVIQKSVFANSYKIFFFLLTGLDFIVGLWVGESEFLFELFGSVLPAGFWAFLESPLFTIITLVCAFLSFLMGAILIIYVKTYKIIFYKDRIVTRYGLISRWEKQTPLTPIVGVHMDQGFWGRVFDYATIIVEKVGDEDWDLDMYRISEASAVKECLEEMIVRTRDDIQNVLGNHSSSVDGRMNVDGKLSIDATHRTAAVTNA